MLEVIVIDIIILKVNKYIFYVKRGLSYLFRDRRVRRFNLLEDEVEEFIWWVFFLGLRIFLIGDVYCDGFLFFFFGFIFIWNFRLFENRSS